MSDSRPPADSPVRFGVFELDTSAGELRKHGLRLNLQDQPLQVLQILLEKPGQLVTREDLQRRLWPSDTFVAFDKGIYNAIKRLRETLSDDAETPRYIETIPRRGYRFIAPVNGSGTADASVAQEAPAAPNTAAPPRPWHRTNALEFVAAFTVAALLLSVPLGLGFSRIRRWLSLRSGPPAIHSLAVLPLQNLSNDPAQEYFSDGMTDALITALAQISSLKVISRTSIMHYKKTDKTLPEIVRELNVDGIIEGTVQRSGDRVRITAQLIHGPSDKHLWANSYERDIHDAFAVERDLAQEIVDRVHARIGTRGQAPFSGSGPANTKALEAYLRGNYYLNRAQWSVAEDDKHMAAQYFQQAIDADSNFVSAYIGLAHAHDQLARGSSEDTAIRKRAAERALELDPNSSEAREILAFIKWYAFDWVGAEQDLRRAVALNPNHASSIDELGLLLAAMGRLDEALREDEIAQELDPNEDHMSLVLEMRGEHKRAIELLQRAVVLHPTDSGNHIFLFRNYAETGMYEEAAQELERTLTLMGAPDVAADVHRGFAASGYRGAMREYTKALENLHAANKGFFPAGLAETYTALGDKDRAFYWLEQAYEHRENVSLDWGLMIINEDRLLDPLRNDPRFMDLLRRVGLPP